MAEAVARSTSKMTDADLHAIATYLKDAYLKDTGKERPRRRDRATAGQGSGDGAR